MVKFSCRALGAVLLSLAVCCSTLGPSARIDPAVAGEQARKVVLVAQAVPDGPGHYIGSAFLIRVTKGDGDKYTGLFLTAKHVVDQSTKTTVVFRRAGDPKRYYATVRLETIKRHAAYDAAVFTITGLPSFFAKPIPLASGAPSVGDWVLSSGYSDPEKREVHAGYVMGAVTLQGFGPLFTSNGRIVHGMSGGPVLNQKGEAVGIVVARSSERHQYSVIVHELKSWLAKQ
jgi:S1-C subfamily serine protease